MMDTSTINWLAVLVAAVSSFAVGSVWYSRPLFGSAWQKLTGLSDDDLKKGMGKTFGLAFLLTVVMSVNLAAFIGADAGFQFGLFAGAAAGIGWVAMGMGVIYLYEHKPFKLWLINAGYQSLMLTLMGGIIGAWQ